MRIARDAHDPYVRKEEWAEFVQTNGYSENGNNNVTQEMILAGKEMQRERTQKGNKSKDVFVGFLFQGGCAGKASVALDGQPTYIQTCPPRQNGAPLFCVSCRSLPAPPSAYTRISVDACPTQHEPTTPPLGRLGRLASQGQHPIEARGQWARPQAIFGVFYPLPGGRGVCVR